MSGQQMGYRRQPVPSVFPTDVGQLMSAGPALWRTGACTYPCPRNKCVVRGNVSIAVVEQYNPWTERVRGSVSRRP